MLTNYLAGIVLGLGLIMPIGAQNVFVLGQGVAVGLPRALWAVVGAALCDTLLILLGAAGVGGLLTAVPGLRAAMLGAGALFLAYLGVRALRSTVADHPADAAPAAFAVRGVLGRTVAVSLLNPHAILDTVGVIGAAIVAQPAAGRTLFTAGAVSASWLWFGVLGVGAALARRFFTPTRRVWFDRFSGLVLLVFAVLLAVELFRA
ncbi:LysE family transporter [Longispora sp. NPDC051575]|uniref:LysE/ArgO family amino acid transporter n=1 Tax=Longispora sp. NPDC051575 TaxID=3154943 RepID=UPI00341B0101